MDVQNIDEVKSLLSRLNGERQKIVDEMRNIDSMLTQSRIYGQARADLVMRKNNLINTLQPLKKQITILNVDLAKYEAKEQKQKALRTLTEKRFASKVRRFGTVGVTDHALVRWIQRVHGFDVEQMKRDIYEEVITAAKEEGGSNVIQMKTHCVAVRVGEMTYVVDPHDGIILTCYQTGIMDDNDYNQHEGFENEQSSQAT